MRLMMVVKQLQLLITRDFSTSSIQLFLQCSKSFVYDDDNDKKNLKTLAISISNHFFSNLVAREKKFLSARTHDWKSSYNKVNGKESNAAMIPKPLIFSSSSFSFFFFVLFVLLEGVCSTTTTSGTTFRG
jgi:hypothetical protein